MSKEKRILLSVLFLTGVLLSSMGISYSLFRYSTSSKNKSELITGDIYMHYNEKKEITMINAMPREEYDSSNYFEFTIDGKNTYVNKDIWYEVILKRGDKHATRTTRIEDKFLKFRLVEVVNNEEAVIFTNKSYDDIENKRIYVATIPRNTVNEVTRTYRLYMWVSSETKIGSINADYDTDTWNNQVYGSVKVNVSGDFLEKSVENENKPIDVTLSCPDVIASGSSVTCNLNVKTNINLNGITANYEITNGTYESFSVGSDWTSYASNSNGFAIGNTDGKTGSSLLGTLNVKVTGTSGNVVIKLKNLNASDTDFNDYDLESIEASINIE